METIDLRLKEFYQFYELVVNYSITGTNSQSLISNNYTLEEKKQQEIIPQSNETNLQTSTVNMPLREEENLCVICFEKTIQIILPCSVSY